MNRFKKSFKVAMWYTHSFRGFAFILPEDITPDIPSFLKIVEKESTINMENNKDNNEIMKNISAKK